MRGRVYYVTKSPKKYGYTKTLEDAIILRTIIENNGWKKPVEGIYIYDGTMYKIKYNNYGTPVFEKEIDAQYILENKNEWYFGSILIKIINNNKNKITINEGNTMVKFEFDIDRESSFQPGKPVTPDNFKGRHSSIRKM